MATTYPQAVAPTLAEDALFYAYRRHTPGAESRPCACGTLVWADPAMPVLGVVMHNRTRAHKAWSKAMGF